MIKTLTLKKSTSLQGTILNYEPHYFDDLFPFNELKLLSVKQVRFNSHDNFSYIKSSH